MFDPHLVQSSSGIVQHLKLLGSNNKDLLLGVNSLTKQGY